MLRGCAAVGGACLILAAIVVFMLARYAWPASLELLVFGVLIVASLVFERRYRRNRMRSATQPWEPTGERFMDPSSGKLVQVYYNPKTGERDYRESTDG
ncbi:MAG TPA: hypothetical protein VFH72_01075 [Candidatus Baltobacteraceae bacterium]|nr:hypothetical protein [Candidatus Baltobacteraceae bacterium]